MSAVFVTGGSRGIGAAIVRAAVASGHPTAFTFRSQGQLAETLVRELAAAHPGVPCQAYALDVRDADAVDAVCDQVLDEVGEVGVVVANAGVTGNQLALTLSDADWADMIDVNLSGAFRVARAFLPTLLANRFGRLIFLSSVGRNGLSGGAAYAASKAGLVGLSGSLAREYGAKGITSNVVVPGFIATDMTARSAAERNRRFWDEVCPLKRMGTPDEVAALVLFLASAQASFVNGQTIAATGGLDWTP